MSYKTNTSSATAGFRPLAADRKGMQPLRARTASSYESATASTDDTHTSPHSINSASSDQDGKVSFLDLPPELRNQAYEYTFRGENWGKIAPHALTRANGIIRRETLAMYCEQVLIIKVRLLSEKQVRCFQEWVELGIKQYPVLPAMSFFWIDHSIPDTSLEIICARETCWPADDYTQVMDWNTSDVELDEPAHRHFSRRSTNYIYNNYIGNDSVPGRKRSVFPPTKEFVDAIKRQSSWVQRKVRIYNLNHDDRILVEAVSSFFRKLAIRANGRDWDTNDLIEIAKFLSRRKNPSLSDKVWRFLQRTFWKK